RLDVEEEIGEREPAPVERPAHKVNITNRTKVLWPNEGITKQELCDYYSSISPWILPFLKDRPIMMVRYPDGIGGKFFYQWHTPPSVPEWIRTTRLKSDEEGVVDVFLIDDVDALLYVSNLAAIPIHVLASRIGRLDKADFSTLDFDVKGASLAEGIAI